MAILCACEGARACHRMVIGRAMADLHFGDRVAHPRLAYNGRVTDPARTAAREQPTMSIAIREKDSNHVIANGDEGTQVVKYEGNLYFDPSAVDESLLVTTDRTYTCPMKGTCQWVDFIDREGRTVKDVAWIYNKTKSGHEAIAGKYGFYAGTRGATKQEG